jgi:hypothetical protein
VERVKVTKQLLDDAVIPNGYFLCGEREELVRESADWLRRDKAAVVGTLQFETMVRTEEAEQLFERVRPGNCILGLGSAVCCS